MFNVETERESILGGSTVKLLFRVPIYKSRTVRAPDHFHYIHKQYLTPRLNNIQRRMSLFLRGIYPYVRRKDVKLPIYIFVIFHIGAREFDISYNFQVTVGALQMSTRVSLSLHLMRH